MIIHSPIFSGSVTQAESAIVNLSGSFTGSFKGIGDFEGLVADSVPYEDVTGKPTLVSGSSQISYPQLSNIPSGIVSSSAQLSEIFLDTLGDGVISGSAQVSYPGLSNIPSGIVSGSSQVTPLLPSGVVSGSSQVVSILTPLNTYTSSNDTTNTTQNTRLTALEASASTALSTNNTQGTAITNLNSFTGSINTTIKTQLNTNTVVSGSSQVVLSSTIGFSTFSSSVDSRIATEKGRVDAILLASAADKDSFAEIVTLINSVDTENDTAFAGFVTSSNSAQAVQDGRLTSLETKTASLDSDNTTQNSRLTSLEAATASLQGTDITITLTGDVTGTGTITNLGNVSFATTVAANSVVLGTDTTGNFVGTITAGNGIVTTGASTGEGISHTISVGGGVVSGSAQVVGILSSLNTYTASNDTTNTTQNSRLDQLSTASGSAITRLTTLEVETANLEAFTGSINTTIKNQLNANTVVSGSSQVNADTITNFDTNVKDKLNVDGVLSGSVINGSKTFSNDVVVSGNLTVNGTTTTINSNTVNIGDNIIVLNSDETGTPSQNGGIEIERGTSTNSSLIWNEAIDQWQAGLSGSEISLVDVSSTQTLFNKTINGGNNNITNISNASLVNSSITIAGTSTALGGSIPLSTITGASGIVSSSNQVVYTSLSSIPNGIVSGSSQVDVTLTTGILDISSRTNLAVSDTATIDMVLTNDTISANVIGGVVSGSSQITYSGVTGIPAGIVSGSTQVTPLLPTGVVSGSSQVVGILSSLNTYTSSNDTTNTTQNTRLTALEASASTALSTNNTQGTSITNLNSFTGSINTTIKGQLNANTVVSGSSQVVYTSLSSIPVGIVSGSTQVIPLLPIGVVSGSSQVNADTITNFDTNVKDKLNLDLVVSGSASSVKTFLSLQNVTNESKATMFSSPTFTGTVSGVTATMVGLGNVTNESKATMFTSPSLTGTPIAPTAVANTNSTQIATTAYVQQELTDLIGGANEAFDTLLEISASLAAGDSQLNTLVSGKLSKASNLSDLTDTSAARTNLGLVIGTNVQAFNSTLASVAGGTYSGDDSITTIGTVTAGNVTAILPTGVVSGSSQINVASTTGDIALGTRTSGNYVATMTAGTGITVGTATGEGSTPVITNTGVTSNVAGTGISVSGATGAVTITNTSPNATHTGDVTGATALTIANNAVTNVKAADMAVNTIKGRVTAGTGDPEDLTAAQVRTIINVANGATANTGTVTSVAASAGTGISISGSPITTSGTLTITNTGVTSAVAGTGVGVSAATGAVTFSIGQAVATSSNVQFNSIGIGMAASATAGRIDATNDVVAFSSSDIRFKENITPIENALDKISKINGYTYDWKEENKIEHGYDGNDVGVIAQEIEEILPQLVQTRESGFKAVKYDKLVALLIAGMKEQQLQIEELKSRLS